jgi:hypothetical protein
MAQTTDGTATNPAQPGGDLISDEDMSLQQRASSAVPQLGASNASYKIPRSKLAKGGYGRDEGDVEESNPLPVSSAREREFLERSMVLDYDIRAASMCTRSSRERAATFDRRGSSGERGLGR